METVDSVQQALRAWRRSHKRGALPAALRQRMITACAKLGREEAQQRFRVRSETLDRWLQTAPPEGAVAKPRTARRDAAFTFVEVAPETIGACRPQQRRVQITTRTGARFDLEGVFDVQDLLALVRGLGA